MGRRCTSGLGRRRVPSNTLAVPLCLCLCLCLSDYLSLCLSLSLSLSLPFSLPAGSESACRVTRSAWCWPRRRRDFLRGPVRALSLCLSLPLHFPLVILFPLNLPLPLLLSHLLQHSFPLPLSGRLGDGAPLLRGDRRPRRGLRALRRSGSAHSCGRPRQCIQM